MSDCIYAITTWSQPQLVKKAIASLLPDEKYDVIQVKDGGFHSLAAAWNYAINKYVASEEYEAVILLADDVECVEPRPTGRYLLDILKQYGRERNVVMTVGYDVNQHGDKGLVMVPWGEWLPGSFCMCITKDFVDKVGYFDPAYERMWFEDTDMYWRIRQTGYSIASVAPVKHVGGASTLLDPEVENAKRRYYPQNYRRYCMKWGGAPGEEKYAVPFNGGYNKEPTE